MIIVDETASTNFLFFKIFLLILMPGSGLGQVKLCIKTRVRAESFIVKKS